MRNDNSFYVYEHWRPDTDICFYVGKGKKNRAYKMKERNPFHTAIQGKLRKLGSCVEIRLVANGLTEEEAFKIECERIEFWRNSGVELANMTAGGEGLTKPSEDVRKRMGATKIGNKNMLGKRHTEESKEKMSASKRGRPAFPHVVEILRKKNTGNKYCLGKTQSDETKKKRSIALLGNKNAEGTIWSKEARKRVSARRLGKKNSPEATKKTTDFHSKPVLCLSDGLAFPSAAAAGMHYGLYNHVKIAEVCRGVRKTAAKRIFMYVDDM